MELEKIFELPINSKIIKFFHENPSSIDTPRGIATWTRENRKEVKKALEELVNLGILIAHRSFFTTGYSYTQNKEIISSIDNYLKKASEKPLNKSETFDYTDF